MQLTATLLVGGVVTVDNAIAHLLLGDAHLAHAAMEVVFRAVGAVQFVREVRTIDDAVANTMRLTDVPHLGHATY